MPFALLIAVLLVLSWLVLRSVSYLLKFTEELVKGDRPAFMAPVHRCPRCEVILARFSRKQSFVQFLFGGWTCPKCGSEFDQLNNVRVARAFDAHLVDMQVRKKKKALVCESRSDKSPIERVFEE